MGVNNLWKLVSVCGRRIDIDKLHHKRLAIDISIWLVQFLKVMQNGQLRSDDSDTLHRYVILGILRRVMRLLYNGIQPVFVFDGPAPTMKRLTVQQRARNRNQHSDSIKRIAEKILITQFKMKSINQTKKLINSTTTANNHNQQSINDNASNDVSQIGHDYHNETARDSVQSSDDPFAVDMDVDEWIDDDSGQHNNHPMSVKIENTYTNNNQYNIDNNKSLQSQLKFDDDNNNDNESVSSELSNIDNETYVTDSRSAPTTQFLIGLPAIMRERVIEQTKERMGYDNRRRLIKIDKHGDYINFSEMQMESFVKRANFNAQVNKMHTESVTIDTVNGIKTNKIASEPNTSYLLYDRVQQPKNNNTQHNQLQLNDDYNDNDIVIDDDVIKHNSSVNYEWHCTECSYHNSYSIRCEMCGRDRRDNNSVNLTDDTINDSAGGFEPINEDDVVDNTVRFEFISSSELRKKDSVFQCHVCRIDSVEQIMSALNQLKSNCKLAARASCNMYAYRIIDQHNNVLSDCDDDGESRAGSYILQVIKLMKINNVLVVVSRYFGGTNLGYARFDYIKDCARDAIHAYNNKYKNKQMLNNDKRSSNHITQSTTTPQSSPLPLPLPLPQAITHPSLLSSIKSASTIHIPAWTCPSCVHKNTVNSSHCTECMISHSDAFVFENEVESQIAHTSAICDVIDMTRSTQLLTPTKSSSVVSALYSSDSSSDSDVAEIELNPQKQKILNSFSQWQNTKFNRIVVSEQKQRRKMRHSRYLQRANTDHTVNTESSTQHMHNTATAVPLKRSVKQINLQQQLHPDKQATNSESNNNNISTVETDVLTLNHTYNNVAEKEPTTSTSSIDADEVIEIELIDNDHMVVATANNVESDDNTVEEELWEDVNDDVNEHSATTHTDNTEIVVVIDDDSTQYDDLPPLQHTGSTEHNNTQHHVNHTNTHSDKHNAPLSTHSINIDAPVALVNTSEDYLSDTIDQGRLTNTSNNDINTEFIDSHINTSEISSVVARDVVVTNDSIHTDNPLIHNESMESRPDALTTPSLNHVTSDQSNTLRPLLSHAAATQSLTNASTTTATTTTASATATATTSDTSVLSSNSNQIRVRMDELPDMSSEPAQTFESYVSASYDPNPNINYINAELQDELHALHNQNKQLISQHRSSQKTASLITSDIIRDCKDLLRCFGIPYIDAPGEAEAQCVILEKLGLVDGVVSDDSDTLVFGGSNIYKNFFDEKKHAEYYSVDRLYSELGLNQQSLIHLALLLGCDYTLGVRGIGIVNAMEIVNAFTGSNAMVEFREWCYSADVTMQPEIPNLSDEYSDDLRAELMQQYRLAEFKYKHRNMRVNWNVSRDFPNRAVINAYLHPNVDKDSTPFIWAQPSTDAIYSFCARVLHWPDEYIHQQIDPVLDNMHRIRQSHIDTYYQPKESDKFAMIRSTRLRHAVTGLTNAQLAELIQSKQNNSSHKHSSKRKNHALNQASQALDESQLNQLMLSIDVVNFYVPQQHGGKQIIDAAQHNTTVNTNKKFKRNKNTIDTSVFNHIDKLTIPVSTSSIIILRSPVLVLWCFICCIYGTASINDIDSALSIARYVQIKFANSKGSALRIVKQKHTKINNNVLASHSVRVLNCDVACSINDVAIDDKSGELIDGSSVRKYCENAFGSRLSDALAAMKQLALAYSRNGEDRSYLDAHSYNLYELIRPAIDLGTKGWRQKGLLNLEYILELTTQHSNKNADSQCSGAEIIADEELPNNLNQFERNVNDTINM